MSKLVLHIGMEKTGSTSIQNALFSSRKKLAKNSIYVPRILKKPNHNFLAGSYIPQTSSRVPRGLSKYDSDDRKNVTETFKKEILDAVSNSEYTIISGELLFRLEPAEISSLRSDLLETGVSEIRVIGYIRDPAPFYLSFIQQELKGSSRFPSPDSFYIPYAARIQAWRENFDSEFFDFATARTSENGLLGHFFSRVENFLGQGVEIVETSNSILNESLSAEEMQIVQDFRRHLFKESDGKLNDETSRLQKALFLFRDQRWKKPKLSDDVVGLITARHSEQLDYLERECGFNFCNSPLVSTADSLGPEICSVKDIVSNFDDDLYHELYSRMVLTLLRQPFFNLSRSFRTRRSKRNRKG